MENQNNNESSLNWGPALMLGTFVLACTFAGQSLVEVGKTIYEARKAKKEE